MSKYPSLSKAIVTKALHEDRGSDAHLVSWITEDFLGEGDNYVSAVTSVKVKYTQGGETHDLSYIVKLKRKRDGGSPTYFDDMTFGKEARFLIEICPLLNAELIAAGLAPLQIPRPCHSAVSENQDYLFLEDLRSKGFRRYDRRKGIDYLHAKFVLQELARLHAASFLLRKKMEENMVTKYKFLAWEWHIYSDEARKEFKTLFAGTQNSTSALASVMEYESVSRWFKNTASCGCEVVEEQLDKSNFDVICHSDCFTSNILFRYNEEGQPVEVMLLDLQVCRVSSLAIDLNYFIFSSIPRRRRNKLDEYLSLYHSSFMQVMTAAGCDMPFTKEEISQEFKTKHTYGFMFASILIPILVSEAQDVLEFDLATDGHATDFVEELRQNAMRMLANNRLLKPRLKDLFDDIVEFQEL
ncbi:uncharacterized protein LOC125038297 [Penaeus chinensis]|uniref:uncharacterized protein LOC125038297 n=1 Tax=Penaeus chinensis TaxID=139456 RepID=UPI001FB7599E|nr:uncharacterized protein LOC125038297 [Penaeus chinensis]